MNIFQLIGKILTGLGRGIGRLWLWALYGLLNVRRRLTRRKWPDYVILELDGSLSERAPTQPWYISFLPFTSTPLSIEAISDALRAVAADPNVYGVLFLVRGVQLSLAQAESIAVLFQRFRDWDAKENGPNRAIEKDIVVHLENAGNASYVLAAAADRILMPPVAEWNVLGLHAEPTFLGATLERLGVQADVIRVAPWKTAYDRFSRTDMSEADREQLNWLLDNWFESMVAAISQGRVLGENQVRSLIDQSPLSAGEALDKTLIDGLAYEDELPSLLGIAEREARLLPYAEARRYLKRKHRARTASAIGIISLTGTIVSGRSRHFPAALPILGDSTIGSTTVQQLVRRAAQDENLAAVVLHVDSGGGSALASDLIWRELALLASKKPLVAYLGDIAASGGYYIALPAQHIVCQPATLTGSIGVITAKLVTSAAYQKVAANRYSLRRGKNADIYTDSHPWRGEQRDKIEDSIQIAYQTFKDRVAAGRNMTPDKVNELAGGRVWTGRQAVESGLVDSLGDFAVAVQTACQLADLPSDGQVPLLAVEIDEPQPPLSAKALGVAPLPSGWTDMMQLATTVLAQDWEALLGQDRIWMLTDNLPRIRW